MDNIWSKEDSMWSEEGASAAESAQQAQLRARRSERGRTGAGLKKSAIVDKQEEVV